MSIHTNTAKPTLADMARDILSGTWESLPEGDYSIIDDNRWQVEAQCYLDNLGDGCDDPDDLLGMIAQGIAAVDHHEAAYRFEARNPGREYTQFGDWFDHDHYRARASESYVPAGGAS